MIYSHLQRFISKKYSIVAHTFMHALVSWNVKKEAFYMQIRNSVKY